MTQETWQTLWLSFAALGAGVVNAIAGGGTLLTFPALLGVVVPVVANGTSTVALVPASLSAAWGYRGNLRELRRWLALLVGPSLAGGVVGALLVTCLDARYFDALVPWLILTATLLFLLQPALTRRARLDTASPPSRWKLGGLVFFQFLVAVYGGYFGAGIGILMLSALGLMGMTEIHAMNALKNLLAVCINGVSVGVFVFQGVVDWRWAAPMALVAMFGAYAGARLAQRVDRRWVRLTVITIGFSLATHFFLRRWGVY